MAHKSHQQDHRGEERERSRGLGESGVVEGAGWTGSAAC